MLAQLGGHVRVAAVATVALAFLPLGFGNPADGIIEVDTNYLTPGFCGGEDVGAIAAAFIVNGQCACTNTVTSDMVQCGYVCSEGDTYDDYSSTNLPAACVSAADSMCPNGDCGDGFHRRIRLPSA
ncbi:hypothetical protein MNV49_007320 [Pseudohyphozyma bogoriensis]|nr:hypothetical protein MNV49_007320 [Pseudohyphozyma bogoriensis]